MARYLAERIFAKKLKYEAVIKVYPQHKKQIDEFLSELEQQNTLVEA